MSIATLVAGTPPVVPEDQQFFSTEVLRVTGDVVGAKTIFSDSSSNGHNVVPNGTVTATNFHPFRGDYYSVYHNGDGNYQTLTVNSSLSLTGDFTVEAWVYVDERTLKSAWGIFDCRTGQNSTTWIFGLRGSSGSYRIRFYDGTERTGASVVPFRQWTHVAVSRSGTTLRMFVNGVLDANTFTTSGTVTAAGTTARIGTMDGAADATNGFISNLRIVNGTALYTSTFTPSTTPLTSVTGTVLLACQKNKFADASTNAFAIATVNNNASVRVTDFGPFSEPEQFALYGSALFNGSSTDYANAEYSTLFNQDTDFTYEAWVYFTSMPTAGGPQILGNSGVSNSLGIYVMGTPAATYSHPYVLKTVRVGAADITVGSTQIRTGQWYHIAVTRQGSTIYAFLDGVAQGTGTYTQNASFTSTASLRFGTQANAYISNARVIRGTALWTTSFTPPTQPYARTSDTTLLTLQYPQQAGTNRVAISNHFSGPISAFGTNLSQGSYSPFAPNGWSHWMNNGGGFSVANNAALLFGSNNFTIEAWVFLQPGTNENSIINKTWQGTPAFASYNLYVKATTSQLEFQAANTGGSAWAVTLTSTAAVPRNQWAHVAVTRNGSTFTIFINGEVAGTTSYASALYAHTGPVLIGRHNTSSFMIGAISNLRIVNGTALYTAAFAPPTTQLTAVTNTALLINGPTARDASTNAFALTTFGTPEPRAIPMSPFNSSLSVTNWGGSVFMNGSSDYMLYNTLGFIGTGDFAFEAWINPLSTARQDYFQINTGAGADAVLIYSTGGSIFYYVASGNRITATSPAVGSWSHLMVSRVSGTTRMFINGTQVGSSYTDGNSITGGPLYIGRDGTAATYTNAFMAGIRVRVGEGVSANFTPSLVKPAETAGTRLLLNFDGGAIADEGGRLNLQTFSQMSASSLVRRTGSSALYHNLNQVGVNYLATPTTQLLGLGTGDFTIEAWVYPITQTNSSTFIVDFRTSGGGGTQNRPSIAWGTGTPTYYVSGSNRITGNALSAGTWHHIAVVRRGGISRMFVNGVKVGNDYVDSTDFSATSDMVIGNVADNRAFDGRFHGYIEDVTVTREAKYFSTFVPPARSKVSAMPNSYISAGGLAWAVPRQLPLDATSRNYADAILYLNRNRFFGYNDWRLPTKSEVETLVATYTPAQLRALGWPSATNSWAYTSTDYDGSNKWVHGMDAVSQGTGSPLGFSFAPPATSYPTIYAVSANAGRNIQPLVVTTNDGAKFTGSEATGTVTTSTPISVGHIISTNNLTFDTTLGRAFRFNATSGGYADIQQSTYNATVVPWTAHFWVYPTVSEQKEVALIHAVHPGGSGGAGYAAARLDTLNISGSLRFRLLVSTTGTSWNGGINDETATRAINNWYHIAIVFESTICKLYVNGTQVTFSNSSPSFRTGRHLLGVSPNVGLTGYNTGTQYRGYMQDFVLVENQAIWTSNFTPPARGSA